MWLNPCEWHNHGLALAVLVSLQWSATADAGLALQYYPETGSSPNVQYWPQTVLDSDTIVEVDAS